MAGAATNPTPPAMVAMALRRLIGRVIFWPDIARPPDVTAFFIGLTAGYGGYWEP